MNNSETPDWTPVESSTIAAHRYDPERMELGVRFKSGDTYTYSSVPEVIASSLASSNSLGSYFAKHIKGVYGHRKEGL